MQLMRSLNIANSEAEVGYYVGIMVSNCSVRAMITPLSWHNLVPSNPCSSQPKHAQSSTGVGSRITSAENR